MPFKTDPIIVPLRSPMVGKDGLITREWERFQTRFLGSITALENQGPVVTGTHQQRVDTPPDTVPPGTLWYEPDRSVIYVSGPPWLYATGIMVGPIARAPRDLSADDEGFLFHESTVRHLVRWTGTAWTFGPGDEGNGFFRDFAIAPQGIGWQLCNGTATSYLTVGSPTLILTPFATPDLIGTPGYRKSGSAYSGVSITTGGNLTGAGAVDPSHITVFPYFRR